MIGKFHNQNADYQLYVIYSDKKYKKKDLKKSLYHLEISANKRNSDAQLNLGFDYYEGQYLSFDINKAISYLSKSAEKHNSEAISF